VLQSVLRTYPLVGIVGQQLVEDVPDILSAPIRQEFLYPDALLQGEVYLHVGGLAFEPVKHLLPWSSQNVVDSMYLVELVLAGKQGFFGYELDEDAAALGGPVPAGGDVVGVGERGVFSLAGAEVCEFDEVAFDQDVFGFDIPVEDALAVHEIDGTQYLEHVELDFLEGQRVFLVLETLIHVHIH
jgi:hypothetical protein